MTAKLPPSASVANVVNGAKLHAPAAARNAGALCDLIRAHGPERGEALEIASGTGQHAVAIAAAFPDITWQPTELGSDRLVSIEAYRTEASLPNLRPPARLDATRSGWHADHSAKDLVLLVNLLHLITAPQARAILTEALGALSPGGCFILYGPFMRQGQLTSAGDATFHAQLTGANPAIGYKNDADITEWLVQASARSVETIEMPANNLAFVARR